MALVLTSLESRGAASHQLTRDALRVVDVVRQLDGLEWRAVAGEDIDLITAEVELAKKSLDESFVNSADESGQLMKEFVAYADAVDEMLVALGRGDVAAASEIDELLVDPQFEKVVDLATSIADRRQAAASSTERTVRVLTWLVTTGAVVMCAILLSTVGRAHERARRAAVDRRFRSLVESSRDVIMVADDDGVEFMSPTLGPLRHYCPAGTRRVSRNFLPPSAHELWCAADDRLRDLGGHHQLELTFERSDEMPVYVEADGHLLDGAGGERVWVWRDITARKALELQLTHQAFHDSLTGIANRSLFRDRVDHALARSVQPGTTPVHVLFCDLDNFKAINDSVGHSHGDRLLEAIAMRISGCVRPGDTVARLGGDEFAILLEDADVGIAEALAERLLGVVSAEVDIDGRWVHPSISIGIATAGAGTTMDDLLRNADIAMYSAKRGGKGRAAVFEHRMHAVATEGYELLTDLKHALANGELALHYQPTIGLDSGRVDGVEALLRWQHPTRGLIPPGVFIPIAEDTGLIREIGDWVIAEACRAAAELGAMCRQPLLMNVNLSPQQLHDRRIVSTVSSALQDAGLDPGRLVLEVTEGVLIDDPIAVNKLHELHALGVLIAIDDFGTGYTSISYLQELPVQILKIDRSFVSGDALAPSERSAFLHAMIGLAKSLHIHSVAEGIEEADQLDELRALGCESGQGFLWAKAQPLDELRAVIAAIESAHAAI